jgi:hypothetical protein
MYFAVPKFVIWYEGSNIRDICVHQNFVMCIQNRDVTMKLARLNFSVFVLLKPQTILLFYFFTK